jgi:hypothetical protein
MFTDMKDPYDSAIVYGITSLLVKKGVLLDFRQKQIMKL